ncbi:metal ABC transporter ATP-binding protein [Macrococcus brunensis]|uniref:Metal ABC transporter ATP-binding protein n=1 Tax=Macrococcus brunensis TaxID=198483 RepID=A0A4R6BDC8_9STAP|nr:metal ABC transporter ATP-binding protein [Macrococcus brunensis]TDL97770.1 metal ABC transporter ATP-binding protein [Macrococcus brunensis]
MIHLNHLTVTIDGKRLLDDICYQQNISGIIGIMGPNGAGKSTLIKSMLGFLKHQGTATYHQKEMKECRRLFSYIPQRSSIDVTFPITVEAVVRSGAYRAEKGLNLERQLAQFRLTDLKTRTLDTLSGGQLQRVLFARALMAEREVYFLDEPFVGIDYTSTAIITDMLFKLKNDGKRVFIVHHDIESARTLFDEILLLNKKLIQTGGPEILTDANLKTVYFPEEEKR